MTNRTNVISVEWSALKDTLEYYLGEGAEGFSPIITNIKIINSNTADAKKKLVIEYYMQTTTGKIFSQEQNEIEIFLR